MKRRGSEIGVQAESSRLARQLCGHFTRRESKQCHLQLAFVFKSHILRLNLGHLPPRFALGSTDVFHCALLRENKCLSPKSFFQKGPRQEKVIENELQFVAEGSRRNHWQFLLSRLGSPSFGRFSGQGWRNCWCFQVRARFFPAILFWMLNTRRWFEGLGAITLSKIECLRKEGWHGDTCGRRCLSLPPVHVFLMV